MLSPAEITETIMESQRGFAAAGYGLWLVSERHGTELVGTAGLRPLEDLGLEIFYSLAPRSWGRGYATEAARAVVEHALGPLRLPEVLAEVDEGNAASVAGRQAARHDRVRRGARRSRSDDPLPPDGPV